MRQPRIHRFPPAVIKPGQSAPGGISRMVEPGSGEDVRCIFLCEEICCEIQTPAGVCSGALACKQSGEDHGQSQAAVQETPAMMLV